MPDSANASLWQQINGLRDDLRLLSERIARMEEQQRIRAEASVATQRKVDELYAITVEARGAARLVRFLKGALAAAAALILFEWQRIQKWLS